jgi:HAD superfamily hydrolase (TIGR01509 family)
MTTHPYQAVIFDLDGTLINTEAADYEAFQQLCQEIGATVSMEAWADKVVGVVGGYNALLDQLVSQTNHGLTKEKLWQRIHQLWELTLPNMNLMPGAIALLTDLHTAGYPLAIASASDRNWVNRWLAHFSLTPYFQTITTGDDVTHNKPAPDIYLYTAAQLGARPEACLVFEDSLAGATAAVAAGMTVVAVPSPVTRHVDFSRANHIIPSLNHVSAAWVNNLPVNQHG